MVRTSSRGDMRDVIVVRAMIPAERGTSGAGSNGGSVTFRRWSYVSMYDVAEGTPMSLGDRRSTFSERKLAKMRIDLQ